MVLWRLDVPEEEDDTRVRQECIGGQVGEHPHRGKGEEDGVGGSWKGDRERGVTLKCK